MTYTTTFIQKNKKNNITPPVFSFTSTSICSSAFAPVSNIQQSSSYIILALSPKKHAQSKKRSSSKQTRARSKTAQIAKARRARFNGKELEKRTVPNEILHMIEQSQRELVNKLV